MRYVAGHDLRSVVLAEGALTTEHATRIALQLGDALDAIHRAGYVHRDVKPQNVMLDTRGHVYLSDFGLAKQALATKGQTRSEQWVGTLDYVAPEQIRGERVDARADVYSLGGVLYFALTGRVPFERENDHAKLWAHLAHPPPRPSGARPELPAGLDAVVLRALAKDPAERQPSAGDLGRAARAAAGLAGETGRERTVARGAAAPATTIASRSRVAPAGDGRRRGPVLAPAALIIAAAVAALLLLRGGEPDGGRRAGNAPGLQPTATPRATPEPPHAARKIRNVAFRPRGLVVARGSVWVISTHEARISRIDIESGTRRGRQQFIGRGAAAIARDGKMVWVAGRTRRAVMGISARTGRMLRFLETPVPPVRVAAGRSGLWVVGREQLEGPAVLYRYDREGRGEPLEEHEFPDGISAIALGGGYVWIALERLGRVMRLAPGSGVEPGGWLNAPASDLAYGAGYVWASVQPDSVAQIDPHTRNAITTDVAPRPEQLVVANNRVWVASSTDHSLVVLNPRTGRPVKRLRVPPNPYGIAAGEGHVWVTSIGTGTLTRIDP